MGVEGWKGGRLPHQGPQGCQGPAGTRGFVIVVVLGRPPPPVDLGHLGTRPVGLGRVGEALPCLGQETLPEKLHQSNQASSEYRLRNSNYRQVTHRDRTL